MDDKIMAVVGLFCFVGAVVLFILVAVTQVIPWWVPIVTFVVSSLIGGGIVEYEERRGKELPTFFQMVAAISILIAMISGLMFFICPGPVGSGGG